MSRNLGESQEGNSKHPLDPSGSRGAQAEEVPRRMLKPGELSRVREIVGEFLTQGLEYMSYQAMAEPNNAVATSVAVIGLAAAQATLDAMDRLSVQ